MMHGWLNFGHQMEKIHCSSNDALYHCCRKDHKDQAHSYQCQSKPIQLVIHEELQRIEDAFEKDNMPPAVVIAFVNIMK